jgi:peptidoglycan/LPS O-acetylase OafA/YrhL
MLRTRLREKTTGVESEKKQNRDYRLDTLRALAIVLVVLWHIQPFRFSAITQDHISRIPQNIVDVFNYQLSLIGVPIFYLVSLYLFYSHMSSTASSSYLWRRIRRIAKLFIFWTAVQIAIYFVVRLYGHYYPEVWLGFSQRSVALFFVLGGPTLPLVGDPVFYFLVDLAILTILAFLYARISDKFKTPVGISVIVFSAVYFEICHIRNITIAYPRPDSFIIYVPIAYMLYHNDKLKKFWFVFLAGFILFSAHNIWLLKSDPSVYARISIVFGAVAVFLTIYYLNLTLTDRFTQFLARYSLGIFAIHKYVELFFILSLTKAFSALNVSQSVRIFNIQFSFIYLIIGVFAVIFTFVCVRLLSHSRLKEYVS